MYPRHSLRVRHQRAVLPSIPTHRSRLACRLKRSELGRGLVDTDFQLTIILPPYILPSRIRLSSFILLIFSSSPVLRHKVYPTPQTGPRHVALSLCDQLRPVGTTWCRTSWNLMPLVASSFVQPHELRPSPHRRLTSMSLRSRPCRLLRSP